MLSPTVFVPARGEEALADAAFACDASRLNCKHDAGGRATSATPRWTRNLVRHRFEPAQLRYSNSTSQRITETTPMMIDK